MNNYCINLDLPLPLFRSKEAELDFLKLKNLKLANHFKLSSNDLSDEILNFFKEQELTIRLVEVFYRHPGARGNIHSDMELAGDYSKLNWIFGGKGSVMNWYEVNSNYQPDTLIHSTAIQSQAIYYKPSEVDLKYSCQLKNPSLVQVGVPHDVINGTTERFCVSIVFEYNTNHKRPTFNEARILFKNYIK